MTNIKKNVGKMLLSLALVGLTAIPASAQAVTLENYITGTGSYNANRVALRHRGGYDYDRYKWGGRHYRDYDYGRRNRGDRFDIDIRQEADIRNDIDIDANTGRNRFGRNTYIDDFRTGDIDIGVDIENEVF